MDAQWFFQVSSSDVHRGLSQCDSVAVINDLGRKGFIYDSQVNPPPSLKEVRAGTHRQELKQR